tara:strand:- start:8813 stop:9268 length:456 start_codon:yes stop_codon:yes gene_type:complete
LKKLAKQEIALINLNSDYKKIKYYESNDFKSLISKLLSISKFIGITEPPDMESLQMLAEFISEFWSDFSIEEIKNAFNLSIIDDKAPFTHYNRFTPQLLSSVLTSYKKKRSKAIIKYNNELDETLYRLNREHQLKLEKEEEKGDKNWKIPK